MTYNGLGPTPVATGGEAQKFDPLGSKISLKINAPSSTTQAESTPGNGQAESYGAYTIKRQRRTKAAIASIRDTVNDILEQALDI